MIENAGFVGAIGVFALSPKGSHQDWHWVQARTLEPAWNVRPLSIRLGWVCLLARVSTMAVVWNVGRHVGLPLPQYNLWSNSQRNSS